MKTKNKTEEVGIFRELIGYMLGFLIGMSIVAMSVWLVINFSITNVFICFGIIVIIAVSSSFIAYFIYNHGNSQSKRRR